MKERQERFVFALILAGLVLLTYRIYDLSDWHAIMIFFVFFVYVGYILMGRDRRDRNIVPVWEMTLGGGLTGGLIGYLISPTPLEVLAGILTGLFLGVFADWWTRLFKHM